MQQDRALRGHMAKVRTPSRMILAGDGDGTLMSWNPAMTSVTRHVTMADVLQRSNEVRQARRLPEVNPLDRERHRGKGNFLFIDGHVAAHQLEAGALAELDLLRR